MPPFGLDLRRYRRQLVSCHCWKLNFEPEIHPVGDKQLCDRAHPTPSPTDILKYPTPLFKPARFLHLHNMCTWPWNRICLDPGLPGAHTCDDGASWSLLTALWGHNVVRRNISRGSAGASGVSAFGGRWRRVELGWFLGTAPVLYWAILEPKAEGKINNTDPVFI